MNEWLSRLLALIHPRSVDAEQPMGQAPPQAMNPLSAPQAMNQPTYEEILAEKMRKNAEALRRAQMEGQQ
jgi:hypothetical protein